MKIACAANTWPCRNIPEDTLPAGRNTLRQVVAEYDRHRTTDWRPHRVATLPWIVCREESEEAAQVPEVIMLEKRPRFGAHQWIEEMPRRICFSEEPCFGSPEPPVDKIYRQGEVFTRGSES